MFFTFVLVYVFVFVCLHVHKCVVVQLSVSYGNLKYSFKTPPNDEGLQLSKSFFPCNKGETYKPAKSSLSSSQLFVTSLHGIRVNLQHYGQ